MENNELPKAQYILCSFQVAIRYLRAKRKCTHMYLDSGMDDSPLVGMSQNRGPQHVGFPPKTHTVKTDSQCSRKPCVPPSLQQSAVCNAI